MQPLSWLKYRLSHIPVTGKRYKMVKFIWQQKRVENAKACTFYWVMIPTSVVGLILFGALLMIAIPIFGAVCLIGRFFGYSCMFFSDKTNGTVYLRGRRHESMFYQYHYNPRKAKWRRYEPWQFLLPLSCVGLLYWFFASTAASTTVNAAGATAGFIAEWRNVELGLLGFIAASYLVGKAFARREINLKAKWEELCPPLVVEEMPQPEEVAA